MFVFGPTGTFQHDKTPKEHVFAALDAALATGNVAVLTADVKWVALSAVAWSFRDVLSEFSDDQLVELVQEWRMQQ
jgi:hypothetical protein